MRSVFLYKPDARDLQQRTSAISRVGTWLPALIAVMCIATESTGTFSSQHTSGWLRPLFEGIFGNIDDRIWDGLHYTIRKSGHFLGYGVVCLSFLRAWLLTLGTRVDLSYKRWRPNSCLAAILCTGVVANLDELHQTTIPSRTGLVSDVLLDMCGGTFMCVLLWLVCWRRRRWEAHY